MFPRDLYNHFVRLLTECVYKLTTSLFFIADMIQRIEGLLSELGLR